MKFTKIIYLSSVLCLIATVNIFAQQQVLEFNQNGIPDNSTLGPGNSIVITFLNNIDNDAGDSNTGTDFNTYRPTTTATITLTNQQYSHPQNTGTGNPSTILGWEFFPNEPPVSGYDTEADLINGLRQDGAADEIYRQLNEISTAIDNNFSSSEALIEDGISTSDNWGAFINTGFYGLNRQPFVDTEGDTLRYHMADMVIEFNEPVTNPILHFAALGGIWETSFTLDLGGGFTAIGEYRNSATSDFDLIASSANSTVSLSKLSGSANFEIITDGAFSSVRNTTLDPDAEDNAAHGSVLVNGEDVTELTFRIYARGTDQPDDLGYSWSGRGTCADPIDETDPACWIVPIYSGSTTSDPIVSYAAVLDQNDDPLDYYIAEDAVLLSISTEVEPDEVELTEGESFRMLSSPVENTSYRELLGNLWIQGENVSNTDSGDPNDLLPGSPNGTSNIYTWNLGLDDSNAWNSTLDVASNIPAGEGFLFTVFEDDDFSNSIESSEEFPKTLSVTGSEPTPPIINDGGGDEEGWLLLGNPFKDPIDVSVLTNGSNTTNTNTVVYVWDRGTQTEPAKGYRSATTVPGGEGLLGEIDNGVIMPFQGFFIQRTATTAAAEVDFTNRTALTTDTQGTFYRKEQENKPNNVVRLEVNGQSLSNSMWLSFSDLSTMDRQVNDALELTPLTDRYTLMSTKKSDGVLLTIGQFPVPDENFEIPVSIETTDPGSYTLEATDFNLSIPYDLYFVDTEEEVSIRMDNNFSYNFDLNQAAKSNPASPEIRVPKIAKSQFTDRFLITTQPKEFGSELPVDVALKQNYPNPFNPTTQISYELPQQSDVRLQVFDMAGRQVATLVNESVNAGTHTVNFDASSLSSGVYLYKLQAGSTVLTRKLTLIK